MTQTSCSACGDTGFVPPFMDPCDCPAGLAGGKPIVAAESLTVEPIASVAPAPAVAPGTCCFTGDGFMLVWTGSKWEPVETEVLTSAEYAAKYRPPMDPGVAAAIEAAEARTSLPPLTSVPPFVGSGDADFDELMTEANAAAEAAEFAAAAADVDEDDAEAEFDVVHTDDVVTATMAWSEPLDPPYPTPLDEWHTPKPAHTMSASQEALIAKLIAERDPANVVVVATNATLTMQSVDKGRASRLIDGLMTVPTDPTRKADRPNSYDGICKDCGGQVDAMAGVIRKDAGTGRWVTHHKTGDCLSAEAKAAMEADRVTEPGLYKDGPNVYRVRPSRTTKRLYGEMIVPHPATDGAPAHADFVYNGKAMLFLRRSNRLTWAEARDFGAAYGACVACGRTLSDARSLVQGYGPTCAGRYSWPTVTTKQAEAIIDGDLTWDDVISL